MAPAPRSIALAIGLLTVTLLASPPVAEAAPTEQVAKLVASDAAAYDQFGESVAIDGDTAVVGGDYDDDRGDYSGSAYVFVRSGGSWIQQAKIVPADGAAGDLFGYAVAVDGDTVLVGAIRDDDNGFWAGSAYVFVRVGNTWSQQAKLVPADGAPEETFGFDVALHGDTAVVTSNLDDDKGHWAGSAYVYVRNGDAWTLQQKILAPDGTAGDWFGTSVALEHDTMVVGSHRDDDRGTDSGSAYVYVRNGGAWSQQAKLLAADGAADDAFGVSVALSGGTMLVGAMKADPLGSESGSAYVFTLSGSTWIQQAKLLPADGAAGDWFGYALGITGDTAVIGSRLDDHLGTDSGSAYAFTRGGATWTQHAKLSPADGAAGDNFGFSVAFDGDSAIIGSWHDSHVGIESGSAYVYGASTSTFDQDGDGVEDPGDNCPSTANADQANGDGDAQGDACDPDDDNDGVEDESDACPGFNDAVDADGDGIPDGCDLTPSGDGDGDGIDNLADNCPAAANADQADSDGDGQGDACETDDDNDGKQDSRDNCPTTANADQADGDRDRQGDACDPDDDNDGVQDAADNCPALANPGQANNDGDGQGDACDADDDNDSVQDSKDNCPSTANADQANGDRDRQGDACDLDADNDGVQDSADNCPQKSNKTQSDRDRDGYGDACDAAPRNPGVH